VDDVDNDLGSVTIGAREIYDELVAMRGDVRASTDRLTTVVDTLSDHEGRLRTLERRMHAVPAALVTAVLAAATTITTVVLKM
jgi:ABC-type transporter Mla subunit MlaD